jgi:hypothetical protein
MNRRLPCNEKNSKFREGKRVSAARIWSADLERAAFTNDKLFRFSKPIDLDTETVVCVGANAE